ncbi:retrovirus-related pol polyprotein from transposon TNT 1-94 [Tanacetum coccineum]|uniref:Retrovirus-related pol polyprotein from transposon TNT 1-94 n=1 Tax=Tanacetum coccineum TaxID=301880 RepID=A0ABQ5ITK8_9ASTR
MLLCKQEEAGIQLSAEQVDWKDDSDDEPENQELEAQYLYMAKIQEVSQDDAANSGPIFKAEPSQKVQYDNDNYNVFANDRQHPEQPESVNDTYLVECSDSKVIIVSLDIRTNRGEADQDNDDDDLAKERVLLASLIDKLKCEIDEKSQKSLNNYSYQVNELNKKIYDLNKKLVAHQETIFRMSQEKEAQNKFYKTREDKEIEKVIALENKVKVLDDIVYKTGQSVQTMNMLNRNCKTSFVKPEFLKNAQRANPRLYDIDLKAQLQDNDIAINELKKLIEKMKGKSVKTKFEKPLVIRQPNAFKSQRQSLLGKPATFSDSVAKKDFSKSKSVTKNDVSKDFSKQVTAQILPQNVKTILKNTNMIAHGIPQIKSNQLEDRVMPNNSQGKKQEVEDHRRNFKFFNNKMFVTACNDTLNAKTSNLVEIILFIVDSGCSKHMTGNLKLLNNFVEKFQGMVKFGNDQIVKILGYGDLVQGNITIKRIYYVKGLNHNLFYVGQFNDANLEVAFRKSTCYIRDLKRNDILTGSRGTDLYSITLQDTSTPNPNCLMAKASSSQAWLWRRHLSHLNFDTINLLSKYDIVSGLPKLKFIKDHLYSSSELGKAKRKSFKTKTTPSLKKRLQILHMDLCGPMRIEIFNDETPEVLIDFLKFVQRGLNAQVRTVQTDKGTKFLNKTLHAYFAQEGIEHQTSTARTPEQNNINRSLVIPRHEKTPYHIINGRKLSIKFFHIFGSLCYIIGDGKNLDKMKEKGDACIFVGYSTQSRAYRVYNKRTRVIVETIHVNFEELPHMASDHVNTPPLIIQTTPETPTQAPTQAPTVTAIENINQAETNIENTQVKEDEFINIFSTPVQERGETSSRYVDSSNMHTFYQRHPSEHYWTKDHPLEQVIGNPSQSIRTRRQLEINSEICTFTLTVSRTKPKNIKEAMADSA